MVAALVPRQPWRHDASRTGTDDTGTAEPWLTSTNPSPSTVDAYTRQNRPKCHQAPSAARPGRECRDRSASAEPCSVAMHCGQSSAADRTPRPAQGPPGQCRPASAAPVPLRVLPGPVDRRAVAARIAPSPRRHTLRAVAGKATWRNMLRTISAEGSHLLPSFLSRTNAAATNTARRKQVFEQGQIADGMPGAVVLTVRLHPPVESTRCSLTRTHGKTAVMSTPRWRFRESAMICVSSNDSRVTKLR
jgi:hypothetical protein